MFGFSEEAGSGLFGFGEIPEHSAPRRVRPPDATWFTLQDRDAVLDSLGLFKEMHPVDQAMNLTYAVQLGQLKTNPGLGHTVFQITGLSGEQFRQAALQRIKQAEPAATMIRDGHARFENITVEQQPYGRTLFKVAYKNLRTRREETVEAFA